LDLKLQSLYKKYDNSVLGAFIIHMSNVPKSVEMANRCLDTCKSVGQKAELFDGFDGTLGEIKIPKHLENQSWVKWLKVTDHFQSSTEIACSLSHIALWVKCMEEDKPLIILEHDAIMSKPYNHHPFYNAISYLGCHEQIGKNTLPITPIHSTINKNWNFINRAHAYCVDPYVSKRLFLNVLDRGIFESADVMIKCDDVAIIQYDFYAYDDDSGYSSQPKRKMKDDHRFNK
jgi:GR25 family glycosyltransferase involved in LPS biosynthesis